MSDTRSSYLSPPDFHRLDWACAPIRRAFRTPPYLVGSVLQRSDYRDIDVRLILDDEVVERMFAEFPEARLLVNIALSDLLAKTAGQSAPIDFQIQSQTEADAFAGERNPLGMRWR